MIVIPVWAGLSIVCLSLAVLAAVYWIAYFKGWDDGYRDGRDDQ